MFRGGATSREAFSADLFSFAGKEEFDRIAEAVHGVESRYGTDLRMWRLDDLNGPQGPMQVSAAAAFDVGGGDRFNVHENILLGRAYLARLLRRYGSWSDALAAYNWVPVMLTNGLRAAGERCSSPRRPPVTSNAFCNWRSWGRLPERRNGRPISEHY